MYLLNAKRLSADLASGKVTEKDKLRYLVIYLVLNVLGVPISVISQYPTHLLVIETIMMVTVTIVGILWLYRVNQTFDGKNFVERLVCLSIPVIAQVLLIGILMMVPYGIAGYLAYGSDFGQSPEITALDVATGLALYVSYFLLLHLYFKQLARRTATRRPRRK